MRLILRRFLQFAPLLRRSQSEKYSHCTVPVILDGLDLYLASAHSRDRCRCDETRSTNALTTMLGVESSETRRGWRGLDDRTTVLSGDWGRLRSGSAEGSVGSDPLLWDATSDISHLKLVPKHRPEYQSGLTCIVHCSIIIMDGLGGPVPLLNLS